MVTGHCRQTFETKLEEHRKIKRTAIVTFEQNRDIWTTMTQQTSKTARNEDGDSDFKIDLNEYSGDDDIRGNKLEVWSFLTLIFHNCMDLSLNVYTNLVLEDGSPPAIVETIEAAHIVQILGSDIELCLARMSYRHAWNLEFGHARKIIASWYMYTFDLGEKLAVIVFDLILGSSLVIIVLDFKNYSTR